MEVYIKGLKMPKSCWSCDMPVRALKCPVQTEEEAMRYCSCRHKDCPIIPVPAHGRLIDADAPIKVWDLRLSNGDRCSFPIVETTVSKFLLSHLMGEVPPTIIPAEEGET